MKRVFGVYNNRDDGTWLSEDLMDGDRTVDHWEYISDTQVCVHNSFGGDADYTIYTFSDPVVAARINAMPPQIQGYFGIGEYPPIGYEIALEDYSMCRPDMRSTEAIALAPQVRFKKTRAP